MNAPDQVSELVPAATVVLLRDGDAGLETLMLHRASKGAFAGHWVFPGGRVEPDDEHGDDPFAHEPGRRAAVREAEEESGLRLEPDELVTLSRWVPPPIQPRRFATWFFVARAVDGEVVVDGGEIRDHVWSQPAAVIERRERGEIDLAPPTYVTLADLAEHGAVDEVMEAAATRTALPTYETCWVTLPPGEGAVAMWAGDAGYDSQDPSADGPRHRLWMRRDGWQLERD